MPPNKMTTRKYIILSAYTENITSVDNITSVCLGVESVLRTRKEGLHIKSDWHEV